VLFLAGRRKRRKFVEKNNLNNNIPQQQTPIRILSPIEQYSRNDKKKMKSSGNKKDCSVCYFLLYSWIYYGQD